MAKAEATQRDVQLVVDLELWKSLCGTPWEVGVPKNRVLEPMQGAQTALTKFFGK